ncbi:GLMPB protein, partial [Crotophaga sulcirostris]|nr:GLMPB protein [Crotophaga sulcirostris]
MQYNPGWNSSSVNLLHVRAVGPADTLHYVWSSIGAPAVLLVATENGSSSLRVNWSRLLSPTPAGALWIDPPSSVVYSAAVVFTKVGMRWWGKPNPSAAFPAPAKQPMDIPPWLSPSLSSTKEMTWPSVESTAHRTQGELTFYSPVQVTAYEAGGRDGALPSLLHTANSSKVEFVLAGVAPRGNGSRFALEVAMVEELGVRQKLRSVRSIDDEYTPTIFEMLSLVAESQNDSSTLSFLQWKATAYGSRTPKREDGIQCRSGSLQAANWTLPVSSIVRAYFGDDVGSTYTVSAVNISFGGEEGGVYQEKRYLSWSALLGFGQPPLDTFSPLVISIVAVALGTPVLMLLVGTCLVVFAQRKRYSEYEPIN